MENRVKKQALQGEKTLGVFFELGGSAAAECLALAGLDFFIVDTEHGPYDVESAIPAILAARLRGTDPFVRIKDATRPSVLKMLDVGAAGLIVPNIKTIDEVTRLVEYAKYTPMGNRGFAWTRAAGFGFDDVAQNLDTYFSTCNQETLLVPQCETVGCLESIEKIAALPGVDGIFVGPYDLSIALGVPGQMDAPVLQAAIARVLAACRSADKLAFIYAPNAAAARKNFSMGFDAVACGMDAILLTQAVRSLIAEVRTGC